MGIQKSWGYYKNMLQFVKSEPWGTAVKKQRVLCAQNYPGTLDVLYEKGRDSRQS